MLRKNQLPLIALLALAPAAYAVPGAPPGAGGPGGYAAAPPPQANDPTKAGKSYKLGYEEWQMAAGLQEAGEGMTGEEAKRNKEAVTGGFERARDKFRVATEADPNMKEAWNMLGYTSRMLGDYDASLKAYEKALALQPDYPEAIEYRAELFLLTGRLADAKDAYAWLLKSSKPEYAETLKASMKDWAKTKKATPGVADADRLQFTAWVKTL